MTEAVCYISNEIEVLALCATQEAVNGVDDYLDDIDVLPLVEATDVVGLGNLAVVEDRVDRTGMILDIQPVTHVLALAIDREGFAVADVVDEQRYQLLWELIRTIVVRAVGHDGRHAVGIVEGTDEMV